MIREEEFKRRDPLSDIVYELTSLIKNGRDIDRAAKIAMENNLTIEQIVSRTMRLTIYDIAKLADAIISLKR